MANLLSEVRISSLPTDAELSEEYRILRANGVIAEPIKNFSRFPRQTKLFFMGYVELMRHLPRNFSFTETAILTMDRVAADEVNDLYYKDFVANGSIMGSGNLFIYTLPTSSASEISIIIGAKGQNVYMSTSKKHVYAEAVKSAQLMLDNYMNKNILIFVDDGTYLRISLLTQ